MRITPIKLQKQNALIDDYRKQHPSISEHFDYDPYSEATYHTRAQVLQQKYIDREQLTEALAGMNKRWDAPEAVYRNINRLKKDNSVVVIGGQQAGLLTGPMYTINKIISIIQFAKDQESRLQIPVIPVFWIAGEDHDFDEINHIYVPEENSLKKHKLQQQITDKCPVSTISIDQSAAAQWVDNLFERLTETEHTQSLYRTIQNCLHQSATYVDFFARVIYQLFDEEGIVLVDSADSGLRELEREHFTTLIKKQREISSGVHTSLQQLSQKGYSVSLDTESDDAHLFYHEGDNRILLTRDDEGNWVGKQNEVQLTTEEMLEAANNHPVLLSNNVVTRPLMQECLFPTLAFIGGPGEVGYWSALKPAFQAVNMEMPPVLPRLSLTLIDRHVEKIMLKYGITGDDAVNYGAEADKIKWLTSQSSPPVQQIASEVRQAVAGVHKPLRDIARETRTDLGELADKNLYYLNEHIAYLENRIMKTLEEKYVGELHEFDLIHNSTHPHNGLQERIWNPLFWLNDYGVYFIKQLARKTCSFEYDHHIVYL
ncbi:bacillithiol biosynthesis cysteine-adding enzyme BshC [Lentibacillus sp. CBA3610]|uniref:bacillithiol biosynthesis cysteine-adding enzyme BshC n=1 Tax=Lentibacillus sp. CBA3610 TaxID=2518176 RepID=UPI0015955306|nr:bacillithiol biosynthesis cysteine-adding enzyme BshC [Lentibacillus sp. CBA3610]QKY68951.1 bacillithiol biosynthesis cysteine-adding enzyme BshC [Lentibacillus sp. CBA3610]